MSTWLEKMNLFGYYTSPEIPVSLQGDGAITKVSWEAATPLGSMILVKTSISRNGGHDWTDWKDCVNNGSIPDVAVKGELGDILLRFRIFLQSDDYDTIPEFHEISFEFEPVITFSNEGVTNCKPEIWITKVGGGDFALINTSRGNEEFKFTNLSNGETVYVNSDREQIETDLAATYRYKDFNNNYLNLPVGDSIFKVEGNANIKIRYQLKI